MRYKFELQAIDLALNTKANFSDIYKLLMSCKRTSRKVERELRSLRKGNNLTPEQFIKPSSPVTTEGSLKPVKIRITQKPLQVEEPTLSQPSSLFKIAVKEITNNKETPETTPASSMASSGETEIYEVDLKKQDMVLATWGKLTPEELKLSNTLLQVSAFKVINSNEERLAYLRAKISRRSCIDKPRTKSSILDNLSLNEPIESDSDSPLAKSWLNSGFTKQTSQFPRGIKRSAPEPEQIYSENPGELEVFQCKHCGLVFGTGQALGGHMSRKHSGKSLKYNHKKDVRVKREFERMKLHVAKKKYFENLGCEYDKMMQTVEGKMKAKHLINRSQIKKIKATLTEREVYDNLK